MGATDAVIIGRADLEAMPFEDGWTPEQWGEIPSLRQLDAWLAWHLFGWRWAQGWGALSGSDIRWLHPSNEIVGALEPTDDTDIPLWHRNGCANVPKYSTDWGAMGLAVEAMLEKGYHLSVNWEQVDFEVWAYVARWHPHKMGDWGSGAEIPEAVARAAKIVLGGENV